MPHTVDFFFYGTLRDKEVRDAVLGPPLSRTRERPAMLRGFRCAPVEEGAFPALVPEDGGSATGLLIQRVDLTSAARVSLFEGAGYDYEPRVLEVETDGGTANAWVYVPTHGLAVRPGQWRLEEWSARHKPAFLANARRVMLKPDAVMLEQFREGWRGRLA